MKADSSYFSSWPGGFMCHKRSIWARYRSIKDYYESYFVKAKHFSIWGPADTVMFYNLPDGSGVDLKH